MNRRHFLAAPLLLAPLVQGCASADPRYYTLQALPGSAVGGAPPLIELRRIGLAGYLDRPDIVRDNADYRLRIANGDRWGEPLGDLIARTLAENLGLRLPGSSVFTASGAISADPGAVVELDIQRFDLDAAGQVLLLAQVAVSRGRARNNARAQTVRLVRSPAGPATGDQVAAMSSALGELADRVAVLLRS